MRRNVISIFVCKPNNRPTIGRWFIQPIEKGFMLWFTTSYKSTSKQGSFVEATSMIGSSQGNMGTIASQNVQQELKNIIQVTTMSTFKQLEKPFKNLNSFKGYLNRVCMNHQSSGHFSLIPSGTLRWQWFFFIDFAQEWLVPSAKIHPFFIKNSYQKHSKNTIPQRSGTSDGSFSSHPGLFGQSSSGELFIIFRSFPCGCLSDSDDVSTLRTGARKPCVDGFLGDIKSHEIPWNDIKPI